MTSKKEPHLPAGETRMSAETADMLSKQCRAREKSEQKNYPKPDQRKDVRVEHTGGSTRLKDS